MVREYGVDDLPDTFEVDPTAADQALARLADRKTAPTTGADETKMEGLRDRIAQIIWVQSMAALTGFHSDHREEIWPEYRTTMGGWCAFKAADAVIAAAVPDADAIRRLLEISQLAQGLLFMHGAFGAPWPLDDDLNIGNRLVEALEAITLPHDWEGVTAWLAHLAAGDAARTEEGG